MRFCVPVVLYWPRSVWESLAGRPTVYRRSAEPLIGVGPRGWLALDG